MSAIRGFLMQQIIIFSGNLWNFRPGATMFFVNNKLGGLFDKKIVNKFAFFWFLTTL